MAVDQVIIEYGLKLDKLNSDTKALEGKLTNIETKSKQAGDAGTKAFEKTSTSAKGLMGNLDGIAGKLGIAFGVGTILAAGKAIINTTASFQKFEAVLTNTLGSSSKAQAALTMIKDFAATTPFSVEELTASFVKLANQGFIPTANEMRKLGDLAASQGKTFDQLTEAIIDAQTGEFERLKEFGIRASKEGDKVKFTFKGVETQTNFTNDAIRNYILGLGDLEGVSGGMAAISETLGGKLSNLGDSIQSLAATIGEALSPALMSIIGFASDGIAFLGDFIGFVKNGFRPSVTEDVDAVKVSFEELQAVAQKSFQFSDLSKNSLQELKDFREQAVKNLQEYQKQFKDVNTDNSLQAQRLRQIEDEIKKRDELAKKVSESGSKQVRTLNAIEDKLKNYRKELKEVEIGSARYNELQSLITRTEDELSVAMGKKNERMKEADWKAHVADMKEVERVEKEIIKNVADVNTIDATVTALNEKIIDDKKATDDIIIELNEEKNKKILEQEEDAANQRKEIERATIDASIQLANSLFDFGSTLRDAEIDELESQKERGIITEDEYAKRVAEIKRKQAEADKAQALFNIAIQTAESIVKYTGGLPATAPLLALAVAAGAIQAGIVLAKPIPEFAKGGLVGGGDQIIRVNEKGQEFVTKAESTKYGLDYLEALNEGPDKFRNLIYAKDILPALKAQERKFKISTAENMVNSMKYQSQFDDYNLVRAIKGNKTVKLDGETVAKLGRTLKPRKQRSY